jgi:predicted nucleotidyltransferase
MNWSRRQEIGTMKASRRDIAELAFERLAEAGFSARSLQEFTEIVVFGSTSAGLQSPDSDVDVLCIGKRDFKYKTERLDLLGMRTEAARSPAWLSGELASHIARYGTWVKGSPSWCGSVRIGESAIWEKRRRIAAFLRVLPVRWSGLHQVFRTKYCVKVRRETQRLMLMEGGTPIPPTRILDNSWRDASGSRSAVDDRLCGLVCFHNRPFTKELLENEAFRTAMR